jgi:hypothetical protein
MVAQSGQVLNGSRASCTVHRSMSLTFARVKVVSSCNLSGRRPRGTFIRYHSMTTARYGPFVLQEDGVSARY